MSEGLPGGGKPWFVRVRRPGVKSFSIKPSSREGWLVVAAYCAASVAVPLLLLTPEPTRARVAAFLLIHATITIVLIVTAFRMSAPLWRETGERK